MIRWVAVTFIGLAFLSLLFPGIARLGVGRLPGDIRFRLRCVIICLPFGSAIAVSALAFLIAELLR